MERWYRIAFVEALGFSDAGRKVDDALRHAGWPPKLGVFVTDDWVHLGGTPSLVIYFSPATAERFGSLIGELGGEACLKPLPFGLDVHGNWDAVSMMD